MTTKPTAMISSRAKLTKKQAMEAVKHLKGKTFCCGDANVDDHHLTVEENQQTMKYCLQNLDRIEQVKNFSYLTQQLHFFIFTMYTDSQRSNFK